jgi:prolyl oligopeptidase
MTRYNAGERGAPPIYRGARAFVASAAGTSRTYSVSMIATPGAPPQPVLTLQNLGNGLLPGWLPSPDGTKILYVAADSGQRPEWRIRDLVTGSDLPDVVADAGTSAAAFVWAPDGSSVFFTRVADSTGRPAPARIYRWRPGAPPELEIYRSTAAFPSTELGIDEDGRHLIITSRQLGGIGTHITLLSLARSGVVSARQLFSDIDAEFTFVSGRDGKVWFQTNHGAPRGRVVAVDLRSPEPRRWRTVIPESAEALFTVQKGAGAFLVTRIANAELRVSVHDEDGQLRHRVALPGIGSTWDQVRSRPAFFVDPSSDHASFLWLTTNRIASQYILNLVTGKVMLLKAPQARFDPEDYKVSKIMVPAPDGVGIPVYIAHHRNLVRDGSAPLIYDAVASPGVAAIPFWSANTFGMMELGAVYAFSGPRGGEDNGYPWRMAGSGIHREQTISDYLAVLDYLVREKYTSPGRVAAISAGASTAFLAEAVNRRPELFGAVAMGSPITDLMALPELPGGDQWLKLLGDARDSAQAPAVRAMSPLQNIRNNVCYPAMLLSVGEQDPWAAPVAAYRYARAIQEATSCHRPTLLRIRPGQGFALFGVNPVEQVAFFHHALGLTTSPVSP